MSVHYHPGKANVVENALSRLSMGSVAHVEEERKEIAKGCSQTCSFRSLSYEHIRWWCNSMDQNLH